MAGLVVHLAMEPKTARSTTSMWQTKQEHDQAFETVGHPAGARGHGIRPAANPDHGADVRFADGTSCRPDA